jgi:hypothetical protein
MNFSAESNIGMNTAALSTLHQMLEGDALRIQDAWPYAIEGPGNQFAIFGGCGLAAQKGAPLDGTHNQTWGPRRMFKFRRLKGCLRRGTRKTALEFSTLEILFRICSYKGCRVG